MKIWFNQWFSAIYQTINSIKQEFGEEAFILASSRNADHVYKSVADHFILEEDSTGQIYVDWALEVCRKHNIDIFFPKRNMEDIAKHKIAFEELGVTVVCEEYSILKLTQAKTNVYEAVKNIVKLPRFIKITNSEELQANTTEWLQKEKSLILKKDKDEGADSVREIVAEKSVKLSGTMSLAQVASIDAVNAYKELEYAKSDTDMILMPKLMQPEVSVDCYLSKQGFIGIPRVKQAKRVQLIVNDKELIEQSRKIGEALGLKQPYNVQFMCDTHGEKVLLEVNTRISGGLHIASLSGINIPIIVIKDILGMCYTLPMIKECKVSQVEMPVYLEELK